MTVKSSQVRHLRERGQKATHYPQVREQGHAVARVDNPCDTRSPLRLELPLRIYSEMNASDGQKWAAIRRKKTQRNAVAAHLYPHREWIEFHRRTVPKLFVTLTRIGKGKMDDDNLQSGFKIVRDAIARAFIIDDGLDVWEWRYDQRVEKRYAVEIRIEAP